MADGEFTRSDDGDVTSTPDAAIPPRSSSAAAQPHRIEYASETMHLPGDGLLRRVVAWVAIAYGGTAVAGTLLHVALAKKWLATPPNMSWTLDGRSDLLVMAARTALMAALLVGGVLLLKRSRAAVLLLRVAAASSVVLAVVGLALAMYDHPIYASYWSTPGSAAMHALQFFSGHWLPVLLVLLTLPPLARRMV